MRLTGLGRSFIYQLQAQNRFPQRIKIGVRAVGWVEEEVQKASDYRLFQSEVGALLAARRLDSLKN